MGKPKKRDEPCSRGDDCCMADPCERSTAKVEKAKAKKEKKKDKPKKDKKKKKAD